MNDKVSIIIPIYNTEEYLSEVNNPKRKNYSSFTNNFKPV